MKIIDKTPFLKESGEISLWDRVKASWKYGRSWYAEIQAQDVVIQVLKRALERGGYILLRNAILPGTGAIIPMILAGPTGVFVLHATHLTGRYRARGDTWGRIDGEYFKPASPNLVRLTARMARAVHLFLQRQGYESLLAVEGILLAADPGLGVDSQRPAVRIVMRDALERFTFAIPQGRAILSSEAVHEIIDRIQNPHQTRDINIKSNLQPKLETEPQAPSAPFQDLRSLAEEQPGTAGDSFLEDNTGPAPFDTTLPFTAEPQAFTPPTVPVDRSDRSKIKRTRRTRFSGKQWGVLFLFGLIEGAILIAFFILALRIF